MEDNKQGITRITDEGLTDLFSNLIPPDKDFDFNEEEEVKTPKEEEKGEKKENPKEEDIITPDKEVLKKDEAAETLEDIKKGSEKDLDNIKSKNDGWKNVINKFVEAQTWKDMRVTIGDKVYESLEELTKNEEISDELFFDLMKTQEELKIKEIQEDTIDLKGVDEVRRKVIDHIKQGLPYEENLNIYDNNIKQLTNLNLDDQNIAAELNFIDLTQNRGMSAEEANAVLNQRAKSLTLKSEAEKIRNQAVESFTKKLEDEIQAKLEQDKKTQEKETERKKKLEGILKEKKLSDSFSKKITELAFNKTEGQRDLYRVLDTKLEEDPELAYKVLHLILDPKDFQKKVSFGARLDDKLDHMVKAEFVVKDRKSGLKDTTNVDKKETTSFINNLSNIISGEDT